MFHYFDLHWTKSLEKHLNRGEPLVVVTVVKVEGSAPRKSACRMFVLEDRLIETIGGGNLEQSAINIATEMLLTPEADDYRLEVFGLGPALEQCCGGVVTLAFEKINSAPAWLDDCIKQLDSAKLLVSRFHQSHVERTINSMPLSGDDVADNVLIERLEPLDPHVIVFGAGHVGAALIKLLTTLPFQLHWVDSRRELFSGIDSKVSIYSGKSPLEFIDSLPENALNIVMTHSHQLDEDICYQYLHAKQVRFLGLIGSKTKRARFVHRLRDRGIAQQRLSALTCPIGVPQVTGSSPPEIAIAVAAQLLSIRDQILLDTALV